MNKKTDRLLEFDQIKNMIAERAVSSLGRQAVKELLPEMTFAGAQKLIDETKEADSILLKQPVFPLMSFNDVTPELKRIRSQAALNCKELLSVNLLFKAAKRAKKSLISAEYEGTRYLPELAAGLEYSDALIVKIDSAIIGENEVADSASAELAACRRKIRSENDSIKDKLQEIIRNKEYSKYLQDAIVTMRGGRYVVPVKQEYRSQIKGIVHGESGSGATLFIEPMSVVEANNRLRLLEEQEKKEVEAVLARLTSELRPYLDSLKYDMEILTYLDLVFAKASFGISINALPAEFNETGKIKIRNGRHPLIDKSRVIPVSIEMPEENNALIITGPNTGGKTVTLKLVGLFSIMAQSGIFIPADYGAELPVFSGIFADIGDEQSIEQSLSTFSSHMTNIIEILNEANGKSLVLLDELGAGTDPEEGAALALAVLEELTARGAKVFATTHYSQIKAYAMTANGFANAGMEFDTESLKPTYKLVIGVAGASNALLVSKRLGLPENLCSRAVDFMNAERLEFDRLVGEAENARREADKQLEKAYEMQRHAEEIDKRAKAMEKELAEKRKSAMERANREALEIINKAREEAEEVIAEIKKHAKSDESTRTKTIDKARKTLSADRDVLLNSVKAAKKPHIKVDPKKLRIGDSVRIVSLDADGTVKALPDQKGMVAVQAGILSVNVHYSDLELKNESGKKTAQRTGRVMLEHRTVPLSINVSGQTVEEAIIEIDKYLDDAFISGLSEVSIVHGKGTGALRKGVQDYLRRNKHVDSFRLGRYGEGETGVTVVTLK